MSAKRKPCGIYVVIVGYAESMNGKGKTDDNFSCCRKKTYNLLTTRDTTCYL